MLAFWFKIPLWQRVVAALILGVITGLVWGPESETIKWIGDFFIKSIKMLVVPLIFFSLVAGVAALGDLKKLGSVGGRAMLLFVITGQPPGSASRSARFSSPARASIPVP